MSWINAQRSMCCPECGGECTVKETRPVAAMDNALRRRRECLECGHRFVTVEMVVDKIPRKMEEAWNRRAGDERGSKISRGK